MLVRYFMTSPVLTLSAEVGCRAALELLHARGFRRAPVECGGALVGMLSERDVFRALPSRIGVLEASAGDVRVRDVMEREPCTTSPSEHLEDVARVMIARKISALPVLDGGRIAGIITESDLFRALVSVVGDEGGVRLTVVPPRDEDPGSHNSEPAFVCLRLGLRLATLLHHASPGGEAFTLLRASGPRWRELAPALVSVGYKLVELVPPRADAA